MSNQGKLPIRIISKEKIPVRYKWAKEIIPDYVIPKLDDFKMKDIPPTIRGMFYILVAAGVIIKTERTYKNLDKALTRARKAGIIPIDAFADNTRSIIKDFDDRYISLSDHIDLGINYLKNAPYTFRKNIPRWHNQPNYVEIWVEKDAMARTLSSIVKGRDVVVVPNRGWSSITYVYQNIERLKDYLTNHDKNEVHILYFGDFDPSRMRMDELIKNPNWDAVALPNIIEHVFLYSSNALSLVVDIWNIIYATVIN